MADDKRGRDAQADDADRRQRERDVRAAVERGDEPEPPVEPADLDELEPALASLEYPATGAALVGAVGDREIESVEGAYTVAELVPDTDAVAFEAPDVVRSRVQRPTVAAAMKRVVEASETIPQADLRGSQRDAYEKTFLALKAIDTDDDDEMIRTVRDWIVERIRDTGALPGSRAVRREAATVCRANGYEVGNDEWLGV